MSITFAFPPSWPGLRTARTDLRPSWGFATIARVALLRNRDSGEWILLLPEHVFGRNPLRADTHLVKPESSLIHAVVRWRKGAWRCADHSRNGTFVDGRPLAKDRWTPLKVGQELRFGPPGACTFEVVNLSAPNAALLPADPAQRPVDLTCNILLPDECSPEFSVFQTEDGKWMLDRGDEVRSLQAGEILSVAGSDYRFVISAELEDTPGTCGPAMFLRFTVSADEEHTRLVVHQGSVRTDLGERIHHYCLLTLARRRLRDAERGLPPESQGWLFTDELAKLLRIDASLLNIQIYRARNQLMSATRKGQAANLVERRRRSLRLADIAFEVVRGADTEACYEPAAFVGGSAGDAAPSGFAASPRHSG